MIIPFWKICQILYLCRLVVRVVVLGQSLELYAYSLEVDSLICRRYYADTVRHYIRRSMRRILMHILKSVSFLINSILICVPFS